MVDWSLARQVARLASGSVEQGPDPDVVTVSAEMEEHVAAYTRLRPATPVPVAELVSREEWTSINLETLSGLLDPVAERLERRMEFAGPLAGALKAGASATLAAEAGLVMGYLSQRVIGQYEVSLLRRGASATAACCSWRPTYARRCASSRSRRIRSIAGSARTS